MSLDLIQQTALDEDVKLLNAAMTKEEFFALAEKRKRDSAGSGFLEWGKQTPDSFVNEGISCFSQGWSAPNNNRFWFGRNHTPITGISRTQEPIALVNGVQHKICGTAAENTTSRINQVLFPNAPDGTKTYDSATGEVVNYKTDVDPKYGDVAATTNEAVARAFEGLVHNGDFRFGETYWNAKSDGVTIVDGICTIPGGGYIFRSTDSSVLSPSTTYVCEITVISGSVIVSWETQNAYTSYSLAEGHHKVEFTLRDSVENPRFQVMNNSRVKPCSFSYYSCRRKSESVITSRKDLVFLETWHEDLATNDLFNPLGNVQYGTGSFDGITSLVNNLVAQGYSAFGEWDTATKGYGKRWSTMTAVEKIKAIQNPDNNIYYDSETKKYIQVKYRVRVVEGLGDDLYKNLLPSVGSSAVICGSIGSTKYVCTQGALTSTKDYCNDADANDLFLSIGHTLNKVSDTIQSVSSKTNKSYTGSVSFVGICLVQRLNQGAYHPEWNSEGTAGRWGGTTTGSIYNWYKSTFKGAWLTSTKECFITGLPNDDNKVAAKWSGNISSGNTGRPDQYKYFDAIYAGQVEDLRLNANKQDYSRLLEDGIRKAVAGKTRGKGKVPFIYPLTNFVIDLYTSGKRLMFGQYGANDILDDSFCTVGNLLYIDGNVYKVVSVDKSHHRVELDRGISTFSTNWDNSGVGSGWYLATPKEGANASLLLQDFHYLTPEYDSLPWVDIVGNPTNIAATFPNGVVGQWIPKTFTSGSGQIFPYNRKTNQSSINMVFTIDNGTTWKPLSKPVDITKNESGYNMTGNEVCLLPYETLSNFTAPANNSVVVGNVGDVVVTTDNLVDAGNRLQTSTTGNKGKSHNANERYITLGLRNKGRIVSSGIYATNNNPEHYPLNFGVPQNNSPAVKTLYTLTSKDGLLYMQYHGNELKYKHQDIKVIDLSASKDLIKGEIYQLANVGNRHLDGIVIRCINNINLSRTSLNGWYLVNNQIVTAGGGLNSYVQPWDSTHWGDDSTIPVINGEGTKVNLNNETVKTFCHHEMFPIGIADHTESLPSTSRYINFYAMKYVPHSLVQHYDEVDCIKGYDTEVVESICEFTGEPITTEVKVPIMGKELVRKPFYFENNGHIDDAEIERHTQYVQAVDEYIEGLIEESESKTPQLMI